MKYQIVEDVLNEYTNAPTSRTLGEVEAKSKEEAEKLARLQYPNTVVKVVEKKD